MSKPFEKSFACHEKSKYWSLKNGDVKPCDVSLNTATKYWFDCQCGHRFDSALNSINRGNWCPYCCNPQQRLCENNDCQLCFKKSFASHEKSKYWSIKNCNVKPFNVALKSNKKYWFNCECGHEFNTALNEIAVGKWCPYCCNPPQRLCENNNCQLCFEKSFASHEKSKYLSIKNGDINTRNIFKNSHTKYWFECNKCNHNFIKALYSINQCIWCPYCCNPPRKLCDYDNCQLCFTKSFANHKKIKYWSIRNNVNPKYIFLNSNTKYWFNCDCGHEFNSALNDINSGYWCPYCSNPPKKLCDNSDCQLCFEKSFASNKKCKYLLITDENINPRNIFKNSGKKYLFNCKFGHSFNTALNHINEGKWCPFCVNKTEQKLFEQLQSIYNLLLRQFKVEWCKNKRCLPFDFCIPEERIIIELDGIQHFEQVSNWKTPEEHLKNDKYKEKCANENNYSVIRILQDDVFNDKYDWLTKLCETIEEIKTSKTVKNIYLCQNGEYNHFT